MDSSLNLHAESSRVHKKKKSKKSHLGLSPALSISRSARHRLRSQRKKGSSLKLKRKSKKTESIPSVSGEQTHVSPLSLSPERSVPPSPTGSLEEVSPGSSSRRPQETQSFSPSTLDLSDLADTEAPMEFRSRCASSRLQRLAIQGDFPDAFAPSSPPFSERFLTAGGAARYEILLTRRFVDMKLLSLGNPTTVGAEQVLAQSLWLPSVTVVGRYVNEVICEFYANLPDSETRELDKTFVYVRGRMFEFTPDVIHEALGIPLVPYDADEPTVVVPPGGQMKEHIELVSGGVIKTWASLAVKHFTVDMGTLYRACCSNWLPTTNMFALKKERVVLVSMVAQAERFCLGKLLYDQVMHLSKQCCAEKNTLRLIYPNLIFLVLQYQSAIPLQPDDTLSAPPLPLCSAGKLPDRLTGSSSLSRQTVLDLQQIISLSQGILRRGIRMISVSSLCGYTFSPCANLCFL